MSLLKRMLIHTIVYWAPKEGGMPNAFGHQDLEDPVEMKARWEDGAEETVNDQGTDRVATAKVYVETVVGVGGYVMLGTMDTLTKLQPPPKGKAFEVKRRKHIPKLRGKETLRYVLL